MGLHAPMHTPFIVPAHAKMYEGGSENLANGQIGVFDLLDQMPGGGGLRGITNLAGYPRNEKRFVIRQGTMPRGVARSRDNKDYSTLAFAIDDIKDIHAAAYSDKPKVDIVTLGYNGINAETAIKAHKGDRILFNLTLKGRQLEMYNYPEGKATFQQFISIPDCDANPNSCEPECDLCGDVDIVSAVKEAIEQLLAQPVAGGSGAVVGNFVKITPVIKYAKTHTEPTTTDMNYYCLEVCDLGDQNSFAEIQMQYPGLIVKRVDRAGSVTKYMIRKEGTAPADYKLQLKSLVKGCMDECPAGYTAEEGGYVYAVSLEDDGSDATANVEALPNAVSGSAKKLPGQNGGSGMYIVKLEELLSREEINKFVESNPTAIVYFVSKTQDFCNNPTITTIKWTNCGSCKVSTADYVITLPDDECGNGRLEELQSVFPDLNVVAYDSVVAPAGCQRMYKCTVPTDNEVCDECDPIYKDFFRATPPEGYMGRRWKRIGEDDPTTGDLVGIRFESKVMEIVPDIYEAEELGYVYDSLEIEVSSSLPDEIRVGIPEYEYYPLHVEHQQYKTQAVGMGGDLWQEQEMSNMYFTGRARHKEWFAQQRLGEQMKFKPNVQYAIFSITFRSDRFSGGNGNIEAQPRTYDFWVEIGAHEGVQEMINMLGSQVGLSPVSI